MYVSRFDPPRAIVADPPSESLSWSLAWMAASAAVGTAYLAGSLLGPLLQHALAGGAANQMAIYQALLASPFFLAITMCLGIAGYVFGGYVAASYCQSRPIRHAMAAGFISVVIGLVGYLGLIQSPFPRWMQALGFLITIPSMYAGARWSMSVQRKRNAADDV